MPEPSEDPTADGAIHWAQEIRLYLPIALRMAIRLCGDANVAEDLVQDALLKIARSRQHFRGDCQLRTWMNRILINVGRDWMRSQAAKIQPLSLDEHQVQGHRRNTTLEQRETAMEVWTAISKLPQRQREVVTLSVWQEMPATEIAETLEISVQNVYSNLSAAKQQLRNSLAEKLWE